MSVRLTWFPTSLAYPLLLALPLIAKSEGRAAYSGQLIHRAVIVHSAKRAPRLEKCSLMAGAHCEENILKRPSPRFL